MNAKILIAILAIVAVAGCTIPGIPGIPGVGPGTFGGGRGLEMTSFTADPSSLYSGSTVKVIMEVENQGGFTAPATRSFAYLTGTNMKITSIDNNYWHRLSGDTNTTECGKIIADLEPADVVKGTPGDKKTFKWSLRAPNMDPGTTSPNTFIGRVYTNYMTVVNGNAWVYTEAEAEAAKTSGRASNKATFTSTSGPVSLEVSASPDPVIISTTDNSFTLKITIKNSQTGTIYKSNKIVSCPPSSSLLPEDLNKVDVTITAGDFDIVEAECIGKQEQELISGNPTDMLCELRIKTGSKPATYGSFPINVKAEYGYYTERTASVTVQGKTTTTTTTTGSCGDGVIDSGETCTTCPQDACLAGGCPGFPCPA
jgi:hypothetical protein